ncbi:epidermal growth factor-like protein isoform X1 [Schistocerca gregaria]|uniref:epidermal growth factor-like protein isoform X1 n=1 Tax=Schistocerca gregaria TaxID=7010 RepID=UPI00211E3282|nr:epidermal growth factor-like protein isoform X1 [Schistocerca gregaria]
MCCLRSSLTAFDVFYWPCMAQIGCPPAVSSKVSPRSCTLEVVAHGLQLKQPPPTDDLLKCKPWCPPGCPRGRCVRHNTCSCGRGYKDKRTYFEVRSKAPIRCKPVCTYGCINADCVAPEMCRCWAGYGMMGGISNMCFWGVMGGGD